MVNKIRLTLIVAVLSLVATGLFPSNLSAQVNQWSPANEFLAAGSSAQFNVTAIAALDPNAVNGNTPCTAGNASNHWTFSSALNTSGMQIHDPRSGGPIDESGPVWIGWDGYFIQGIDYAEGKAGVTAPPAGTGIICAYVSLDSVVGMREYFANGQFKLESAANTADAGAVPGLPLGSNLPQEVYDFFTVAALGAPQVINVAPTDIRPEDGKFATLRAMLTPAGAKGPANYAGLGYGSCVGTSILDSTPGSSKLMQVADFILDPRDVDCLTTSSTPRNYYLVPVGAAPVLVIVNNTNTGAGHTGYSGYTQVNSAVLAGIFSGRDLLARDIGNNSADPVVPLTVFHREPLSGTYNTFDFNVTCVSSLYPGWTGPTGYRCQETGVDPTVNPAANGTICAGASPTHPCGNPMYITYATSNGNAVRRRVIGTGNMVKAVCGAIGSYSTGWPDSIGYAFWSFSTFKGVNTNCRYLAVDNIDPLYPSDIYYSGITSAYGNPGGVGYLPTCSNWTSDPIVCPQIPFTKIYDGAYPIWSMYRWVHAGTVSGVGDNVNNVLYYVQKAAETYYTDMVPAVNPDTGAVNLPVFRSHFTTTVTDGYAAQYGSNGVNTVPNSPSAEPELGGDMGGQVFTINSEVDYVGTQFASGACTNGLWPDLGTPGQCQQTNLHR
jgi:hypothetical protein